MMGHRKGSKVESPNPDNQQNGAPRGDVGPTHASGPPGENNRWLRSVRENSSEITKIIDLSGVLRCANPAFGRVLGHDPEKVVGTMNVLDYVHPDDIPRVLEETEKTVAKRGMTANKVEYRFRHADGSWRWVESAGTYLPDDAAVKGIVVTVRDVTTRKDSEEKLRFQSGLLDAVGQAVIATDVGGRVVYWNRGAEEIYWWSSDEVMGRPSEDFSVPENLREKQAGIREEVRAGNSWSGEFTVLRKDGSSVPVLATTNPPFSQKPVSFGLPIPPRPGRPPSARPR